MKIEYYLDCLEAYPPEKAHTEDAGFDLRTPSFVIVPAHKRVFVDTGVHMNIPTGYCGLLVSKSGLNVKHGIETTGLIDAGYSGAICVEIYNHSDFDKSFVEGDKISQIIILPVPEVELVQNNFTVSENMRGDNGFGSTGR